MKMIQALIQVLICYVTLLEAGCQAQPLSGQSGGGV
jgi:hypothetical protein